MADNKAQADKVEKDHAATGKPVSPTEDPTDHSVPAGKIAAAVDPSGKSDATVKAKEDQEKLEEDKSLAGKIRKSELFFVRDHTTGRDYVGISPQNDPKATEGSKRLSLVSALDSVAPRTGMQVVPKDGDAFVIGDGFGPDSNPGDWARVTKPDGSPFFA